MGIYITVELSEGFYSKTNPSTFNLLINQTVNDCANELLEYIKGEAPVRTGRLRDGHQLQKNGNWINIVNEAYYWKYVIARGNDYIDRGLLQFINDRIIEEKTMDYLRMAGLI